MSARAVRHLVVTRPEPEASHWVRALREAGWPAEAWPLIVIAEPDTDVHAQTLAHWRAHWSDMDALMFVSAAAVTHFWRGAAAPRPGSTTRCWAPGPGTARALAEQLAPWAWGADRIDTPAADAAQFDSEHLWPVVASQVGPGKRLLIVRGDAADGSSAGLPGSGREWLIERCRAQGTRVEACVAYARYTPPLSPAQREQLPALCGPDSVWLISSSEALRPLAGLWPAGAEATAWVTHPRIGQAARAMGFAHVMESRPTLADVMRGLESWAAAS